MGRVGSIGIARAEGEGAVPGAKVGRETSAQDLRGSSAEAGSRVGALVAPPGLRHYAAARRRCFRQLLEALLFEGVLRPEVVRDGAELVFRITGQDAGGAEVTYLCRGRRREAFGRIRLSEEPVQRVQGGVSEEASSLAVFLAETRVSHGAPPDLLARFMVEVEQTALKDGQSRAWREGRAAPDCAAPYDDLESFLSDGHPYHPGFKSRIGFDLRDNLRYGPEFGPRVRPLWLALHASCARLRAGRGLDPDAFLESELGPFLARARRELRSRGCDPSQYILCPVHPWQWRECVSLHLARELADGRIVALGAAEDLYRPQQSIRTLANASSPGKASLKLSMSLVNTSTSRILAPHTVENAALVSDWLAAVAEGDAYLREECRTILLRERLGVAFEGGLPELIAPLSYGALSCIWRESVHPHLETGERAVPWSALCHLDGQGRPLIDPWIRDIGLEPWLIRLLEVSVRPILHFLARHGIALESHAQNMILVHRDGYPTRVALKDFHDGVRFSPRHLAQPDNMPDLVPTPANHVRVNRNSYITTGEPAAVRDFVLDAFLFINLDELALFLKERYGFAEARFWSLAATVVADYGARFPGALAGPFDILAPEITVEKLANRRLFPESGVQVHSVPNPLAVLGSPASLPPAGRRSSSDGPR